MAHEDLHRDQRVDASSDRSFGLVFAAVFAVVALWPLLYARELRWWAVAVAVALLLVAGLRPSLLSPANKLWIRLGLLLGRVVSPVALGILFFLVFTPIGALMRLMGKDPLRLKPDRKSATYWIAREPPGPKPDSLTNQF